MARLVKRQWKSDLSSGLPRKDRRDCVYEAYVPDPLQGRSIMLDGEVAADVADAEAAVARLNAGDPVLPDLEAVARLLLRAEAVASSQIEGLVVGPRRLARAEVARALGDEVADVTADEVLNNIDAMTWAMNTLATQPSVTPDGLLEVHHRLLANTRLAEHAGRLRTEQNWIGGSSYNPCTAAFVPPPPDAVEALLSDLCRFCNEDSLPTIVQAAMAHAQFETIHPFVDGNGRTGRALIHVILRRRGLAPRVLPPISLMLATWSEDYVSGLTATRYRGPSTARLARDGTNTWIGLFAAAATRSVDDVRLFETQVARIQERWREKVGRVRADSATDRLVRSLPGAPVVTTAGAAQLIGRSFQQTNLAINRLVERGVLEQVTVGRRNRAFEASDVLDAFTALERRLASPTGGTRSTPPSRPAPRRPG